MIKYLIKNTVEMRFETLEDVKAFQEQLRKECDNNGYTLGSYAWVEKVTKTDMFYQVKYQIIFGDIKDPSFPLSTIEYKRMQAGDLTTQEF